MTPIAILFWPAAGILLRRLVPAMLLAVGYAAGWDAIPRPHHAPRILRAGFGKEGLHNRSVPLPSIRRIGRR